MEKLSNNTSGVAGEYFVAAELSRLGFITSVTLKNAKGIDILVTDENAQIFIGIQVKTTQNKRKGWVLNQKSEDFFGKDLFYVFVILNEIGKMPEFHIVPSIVVAGNVASDHKKWLEIPGKNGQKHNDNPVRLFKDEEDKYLNKWNLLREFQLTKSST